MSLLEKIYSISPICIQNLAVSIKGRKNNKDRYSDVYYKYYSFLKEFDDYSLSEKKEYQNEELIKFVKKSYENSKYLQKTYDETIVKNFNGISDLDKLPILTKDDLRKNIGSHFTIANDYIVSRTGGTTGKALEVRFTKEDFQKRMAQLDYFKEKTGFINRKMKRASFTGQPVVPLTSKRKVFWRHNKPGKQMLYSTKHLSEENMYYYVKSLNEYKPESMDGYYSAIYDLANYILRNNLSINFVMKGIYPTSETMTEHGKKIIEKAFSCRVYNQYASGEGAPFIVESLNGDLDVLFNTGYFERQENTNEVLVTSFFTNGTPLIRYKIEDSVDFIDFDKGKVKSIEGRSADYLLKSDGTKISAVLLTYFLDYIPANSIINSQFIQVSTNKVILKLVINQEIYEKNHEKIIIRRIKEILGTEINIEIEYVKEIARSKNGKYKFIINNVK